MKKCLIALAALLLASIVPAQAAAARTTVLVYMCGSDLESEGANGTADMEEMIAAGIQPDGDVTVLVETGGAEHWHMQGIRSRVLQIHRITQEGASLCRTLPQRSMGDAATLGEFLAFAREQAPAKRTLLVLWGHGDGPDGGVCYDDLYYGDTLMPEEIAAALAEAEDAGQRVEAVILDACLMNCVDLLRALGPHTDYIVASQDSTLASGCNYQDWLSLLSDAPETGTGALCARIAQGYIETTRHGAFSASSTMSVLDARRAESVWRAAEALYARLDASLPGNRDALFAARAKVASFGDEEDGSGSNLVDADQLCDALRTLAPRECAALSAAVNSAVLLCESSGKQLRNACGLSLYMPGESADRLSALYARYRPLSRESAYARLIVRMADLARESTSRTPAATAVDRYHIWQGLGEPRPYAGRLWEGLEAPAAGRAAAGAREMRPQTQRMAPMRRRPVVTGPSRDKMWLVEANAGRRIGCTLAAPA